MMRKTAMFAKSGLPARIGFALLLAFAPAPFAAAPARAATPAETFVQNNVQRGLTILNNGALSPEQKRTQFSGFLESLTNIPRIALFTLGPARRTAPQADQDAFVAAFHDYAEAVYESRLQQYSGQTLKVTGSTERAPNDFVVETLMVDPKAKSGQQPVEVDFRVVNDGGKYQVIDASVVGVWLAIEQRDQFTAFLAQHNNSVPQLIDHLKKLTAALRK